MINTRMVAQVTGLSEKDAALLIDQQIIYGAAKDMLDMTDDGLNDIMPVTVWDALRTFVRWAEEMDRVQ